MVLPGIGTGRPAVRGIHNSYCAGVVAYSQHICAHQNLAAGKGGPELRTLPRWGFVVAVPVAYRVASVAVAVAHRTVLVAAVAHRVVFAVDMGNFGMVAALHTDWVAVAGHPELFHSLCKIVGRRLTRCRIL